MFEKRLVVQRFSLQLLRPRYRTILFRIFNCRLRSQLTHSFSSHHFRLPQSSEGKTVAGDSLAINFVVADVAKFCVILARDSREEAGGILLSWPSAFGGRFFI